MKSQPTPTPDMPLADFIESYLDRRTYHKNYRCIARSVGRRLSEFLGRPALVSDLTADIHKPFSIWAREQGTASGRRAASIFRTLCRLRGTMRYGCGQGKRTRPLSDAPDTLWGICQHKYFKLNLRIRSDRTRAHYRCAIADLKEYLGHDPTVADLTDDNLAGLTRSYLDRGLAEVSANQRYQFLRALWWWLASRDRSLNFPTVKGVKEPRRVPRAWSLTELSRLFVACQRMPGQISPGVQAADFWTGLHCVFWDSGERVSALLACRWEWLDTSSGQLHVPYAVRKGREADADYVLRPETIAILLRMKPAGYERIFHWARHPTMFYYHYKKLAKLADLPTDRWSKTHRMRRSVASHLAARGYDACAALGHASPDTTRKSYLDPAIVGAVRPALILPGMGEAMLTLEGKVAT